MRVAVVGAGGLGGMFGGLHARVGHDVVFIARGGNLLALRNDGLTVRLPNEEFHLAVTATDSTAELDPVDLVWFCVKTYDAPSAAQMLQPLLRPETIILPIQNGLGTAEMIASVVGPGHVVGAVNLGGATLIAPGVVEAKGPRREVAIGELAGCETKPNRLLTEVLNDAGIEVQVKDEIRAEIWDKWVVACVTLGLCALLRQPLEPIFAHAETTRLAEGIMQEAAAVAQASGVSLPEDTVDRWVRYIKERVQANPSVAGSMYYDILGGRKLELEAMNGAAVRFGRQLGVPTPLNFAVFAALLPYSNGIPAN